MFAIYCAIPLMASVCTYVYCILGFLLPMVRDTNINAIPAKDVKLYKTLIKTQIAYLVFISAGIVNNSVFDLIG